MEHNRSGKGQRINMSGVLIENQAHGGGMPQFLLKISKIAHLHLKCFFFFQMMIMIKIIPHIY